jgi:hypothetical protein
MPPGIAHGVVLIKQMIFAFIIYQAVGIVRPVMVRGEMILRAIRLLIGW